MAISQNALFRSASHVWSNNLGYDSYFSMILFAATAQLNFLFKNEARSFIQASKNFWPHFCSLLPKTCTSQYMVCNCYPLHSAMRGLLATAEHSARFAGHCTVQCRVCWPLYSAVQDLLATELEHQIRPYPISQHLTLATKSKY